MFDVIPQVRVRVPESCSIIYQLVVPLADYYTSKFLNYGAPSPALGILFQIVEREISVTVITGSRQIYFWYVAMND